MTSFQIQSPPLEAKLKGGFEAGAFKQRASVTFQVANRGADSLAGRIETSPEGGAAAGWFTVRGEAEREFPPGTTQEVTVNIEVPAGADPGRCGFRLRVLAVNAPDEDYVIGPVLSFEVAPPPKSASSKLWMIVAGAAAFLAIAGIAVWLLWPSEPVLANFKGKTCEDAKAALEALQLKPLCVTGNPTADPVGTVVAQDKTGKIPAPGTEVRLTITPGVVAENYRGRPYAGAASDLQSKQLRPVRVPGAPTSDPVDTVLQQDKEGALPLTTEVRLVVNPGVDTGNMRGKSYAEAETALRALQLTPVRVAGPATTDPVDTVLDQDKEGPVPRGAEIRLTVNPGITLPPQALAGVPLQLAAKSLIDAGFAVEVRLEANLTPPGFLAFRYDTGGAGPFPKNARAVVLAFLGLVPFPLPGGIWIDPVCSSPPGVLVPGQALDLAADLRIRACLNGQLRGAGLQVVTTSDNAAEIRRLPNP